METPLISVHWRFPVDAAKRVTAHALGGRGLGGRGILGLGCWQRTRLAAARVVAVGVILLSAQSAGVGWDG